MYPTQPYKIYVCRAFWTAPLTGTDDNVYGQSGAASLAISDPNAAVANAGNHEYFAENTPALN
ncbi:MAG: mep [Massilia sp.]|nr:mep [Massilia sp.]